MQERLSLNAADRLNIRTTPGWILAVLTLLSAINSTWFFLAIGKVGFYPWLMMNSCAPSIFVFFIGYVFANPVMLGVGAGMMFRYGMLGLFVFSWSGTNLFAQVGHVLMTLSVIFVLWRIAKINAWRAFAAGLGIAVVILIGYAILQHLYFTAHPDVLQQLFNGEW